jgi:hypothetical protein
MVAVRGEAEKLIDYCEKSPVEELDDLKDL